MIETVELPYEPVPGMHFKCTKKYEGFTCIPNTEGNNKIMRFRVPDAINGDTSHCKISIEEGETIIVIDHDEYNNGYTVCFAPSQPHKRFFLFPILMLDFFQPVDFKKVIYSTPK